MPKNQPGKGNRRTTAHDIAHIERDPFNDTVPDDDPELWT